MRKLLKIEWLGLMDVVGPFVTPTIIKQAFPNGLEGVDTAVLKGLRSAYQTWEDSNDPIYHREWINVVLSNVLGYQEKHVLRDQAIPESLKYEDRTHQVTVRPTEIIQQPEFPDRGRILMMRLPKGESTSKVKAGTRYQASPISQMQSLLQANNEKIGIVTNGEEWVLVNNCGTGTVGFATWYAYLWLEEKETLCSFRSLLGIRRVFGGEPGSRLVDLLTEGANDQQEVTDRLGYQVRRAVEELVGAFERLDRDSNRELLNGVGETEVYEGVLTVMMRLVFLFCAEERGLLHLGEDLYDRFYAVSTLREQLHDESSRLTEEVLDRRASAWCRLLATFRMVYQGVAHEDLRIPAYGGTLFDPDRFPWLEGRQPDGSNEPPHISDRIVLHLLDSLQVLRQGQEARKLTFQALDVEQIGHVYEGLLDHTAKRALKPVLGLVGKEGDEPEVELETLEAKVAEGREKFVTYLKNQTVKTERTLNTLLDQAVDPERLRKLRLVCGDDHDLFVRVRPFANLVREDSFGNLQVYPTGALYATNGSDRRSTGTHYTPKSLCEEVVRYALEPLVYVGPAEGLPEEEWTLKDAKAIVDLKVCDMAMGSGAFLVAACRFLSIKLVEAWAIAEEKAARRLGFSAEGHFFTHRIQDDHHVKTPGTYITTPFGDVAVADPSQELIPSDAEERLALARRIVADRCLYGVDRNAMAVEMAKLSLWLTTLRRDRPFTFLDHALRHGDSLLGVTERQLELFNMDTSGQSEALLLPWVPEYVEKVRKLRQQIARIPSHDPEAIRRKQRLFDQVRELERPLKFAADALVACELSEGNARDKVARRAIIQSTLIEVPSTDRLDLSDIIWTGRPFHWELEFPDIFNSESSDKLGFAAIIGNPPFVKGHYISRHYGLPYRDFISSLNGTSSTGLADYSVYFVAKALQLTNEHGYIALVTTNSIKDGDSAKFFEFTLAQNEATIVSAWTDRPWAGSASVVVSIVVCTAKPWFGGKNINGTCTATITSRLRADDTGTPYCLLENQRKAFIGSYILGDGFICDDSVESTAIEKSRAILFPYVGGKELYEFPRQPRRMIASLWDWDLDTARSQFPDMLHHLEMTVKPIRSKVNRARNRDNWWLYAENRPGLYHAIGLGGHFHRHPDWYDVNHKLSSCIVKPKSSDSWLFLVEPATQIFDQSLVVIASESLKDWATLQSSIHQVWAVHHGTGEKSSEARKGGGAPFSYTPSSAFETFPFPSVELKVTDLNSLYDSVIAQAEACGTVAKLMKHANDPTIATHIATAFRTAMMAIDEAVCEAYGWGDLELSHGFHETPQGLRFTISPEARKEVLRRLLKLNHERYAEEVAAGLHDKKGKKSTAAKAANTDATTSTPKRGHKPNPNTVAEPRAMYNGAPPTNLFDSQLTLGEADD